MEQDFYRDLAEARQIAYLSKKGFDYDQATFLNPDRRLALCIAYGEQDGDLPWGDLVPPAPQRPMDTQAGRLRAYAIEHLDDFFACEAAAALALDLNPNGWQPWQGVRAAHGDWFLWRDPGSPNDIHADQVGVDGIGVIDSKFGCGLDYYPECQPARFDPEVWKLLADRCAKEEMVSIRF